MQVPKRRTKDLLEKKYEDEFTMNLKFFFQNYFTDPVVFALMISAPSDEQVYCITNGDKDSLLKILRMSIPLLENKK